MVDPDAAEGKPAKPFGVAGGGGAGAFDPNEGGASAIFGCWGGGAPKPNEGAGAGGLVAGVVDPNMLSGGDGDGALLGVEGAPKKEGAASFGGSAPATGAGAPKKLGVARGGLGVEAAGLDCWPKPPNVMVGPPGAAFEADGAGGGAPQPSDAGAALTG